MINIKEITRDKMCSACALHRKPNSADVRVYQIKLAISDGNALVIHMCEDCLAEFRRKTENLPC